MNFAMLLATTRKPSHPCAFRTLSRRLRTRSLVSWSLSLYLLDLHRRTCRVHDCVDSLQLCPSSPPTASSTSSVLPLGSHASFSFVFVFWTQSVGCHVDAQSSPQRHQSGSVSSGDQLRHTTDPLCFFSMCKTARGEVGDACGGDAKRL